MEAPGSRASIFARHFLLLRALARIFGTIMFMLARHQAGPARSIVTMSAWQLPQAVVRILSQRLTIIDRWLPGPILINNTSLSAVFRVARTTVDVSNRYGNA